jgi:alpha-D-xyloside xylohydrolase
MKLLLLFLFIPALCMGQSMQSFIHEKDKVNIKLSNGILSIIPLNDNAVRIQFTNGTKTDIPELILTSEIQTPAFELKESDINISIILKNITVIFDKNTGSLTYSDINGKVFLAEKPGSRILTADSISGEPCFIASQSFDSPDDEALFGLGQFQDGYLNLKGVSRKLIQVNSQIAIPFLYSSKGYGLLWHQYGLTEFNPSDNEVLLVKQQDTTKKSDYLIEVPTVTGSLKVSQQQAYHRGTLMIQKSGVYNVTLDLGDMDRIHFVSIDGEPVIEQNNYWLPPAVSTQIYLNEGEHQVEVICKWSSSPKFKWKPIDKLTTFRSPNAKNFDYVVFYGPKADDVISGYRNLSGNVPMLPLWAYGFWQSRERYSSGKNLVKTVKEFRNRGIPMDVIVQDWQYWGKYGWGVPKFDEAKYPNPAGFIKDIHKLNAKFSISVWENVDKFSDIGKSHLTNNFYIPQSPWLDMFNPSARNAHWGNINKNMFAYGVDSWWTDATEPENDALHGKKTFAGLGDFYRLTYPLFVSQAIYEGQRKTSNDKRVCILTRSAFAGQQRYGTINWSGDIGSTWDSYNRQIVAGLNYTITGMPYWTTDIGGFFRPGLPQFSPGKSQYTDVKYHELLIRWFQWGSLNPVFRVHGYQSETEPWKYGKEVEANIRKILDLRYRLIPYIYSGAWQVSKNGSTIMRPLVMDFQDDFTAVNHKYEYMFGKAFLVAPVTKPDVSVWDVYLPASVSWYDFWTGKRFDGGQTIQAPAPLNTIPLFVKAGSIVPMGKFIQYTSQKTADTLEIRVYAGADGTFELYEDEGDNYNYEKGAYSTIKFEWNEGKQELTINEPLGEFQGMLKKRIFNISWINETSKNGINMCLVNKQINYEGKKIIIKK